MRDKPLTGSDRSINGRLEVRTRNLGSCAQVGKSAIVIVSSVFFEPLRRHTYKIVPRTNAS